MSRYGHFPPRHRQCHRCRTRRRPRQCKTLGFLTVRHLRRKPLPAGRGGQDSFSQQDRHGRQGNRYYLLPTAQDRDSFRVYLCVPFPDLPDPGITGAGHRPASFSSPLKSSPACSTPAHRTAADWRPAVKSSFVSLCSSSPCPFFTGPSPSHSARPATAPACFLPAGAAQNPRRRTHRPPPAGSPGRQPARPD